MENRATEIRAIETLEEIQRQIAALEAAHPDQVEWMPWKCNDDPLALEHWGLVQRRIRASESGWSPARKKAAGDRLRAMQASRRMAGKAA